MKLPAKPNTYWVGYVDGEPFDNTDNEFPPRLFYTKAEAKRCGFKDVRPVRIVEVK